MTVAISDWTMKLMVRMLSILVYDNSYCHDTHRFVHDVSTPPKENHPHPARHVN